MFIQGDLTNEEEALAWLVKAIEPPVAMNLKKPEAPEKKLEAPSKKPAAEPKPKPDSKPAKKPAEKPAAAEEEVLKPKEPKKSAPKPDVAAPRKAVADPKPQGT